MKFHSTVSYISHLFLVSLFMVIPPTGYIKNTTVAQQQSTEKVMFCVTKTPDASDFPNVDINFRLINIGEKYAPITDTSSLQVFENKKPDVALSDIKSNKEGGISYYLIVDKGNRSRQDYAKHILQNFLDYVQPEDVVKIYTDEENSAKPYYPVTGGNDTLGEAISKFSVEKGLQPFQSMNSLNAVVADIEKSTFSCEKWPVIIMINGDGALESSKLAKISDRLKENFVRLSILHIPHPTNKNYDDENIYRAFTEKVGGEYIAISALDEGDATAAFDHLMDLKQAYSAKYRTNNGANGEHLIEASYKGTPILVNGEASYHVNRTPGQVSFKNNGITKITRIKDTDGNYIDPKPQTFQITVEWPDGHPLKLDTTKKAILHIKGEDGNKPDVEVNLTEQTNGYAFSWLFMDKLAAQNGSQFSITLEVFDEFGDSLTTTPANTVVITDTLPEKISAPPPLWIYIVLGFVVFIAVGSGILVLILFLKFRNFSFIERGRQEAAKIVGEVRKTFIGGGGSRKKPLFILHVIEGPLNMLDQDLPVYTESVKLGRDDRKADLIFYGVDTKSSVSGLHARIERVSGLWRIVAISESGSETFVNGAAIPFNEPHELNAGDKIRLGYLARQAVELEFVSDIANHKPPASNHKPTIPVHANSDDTNDDDLDKTNIVDVDQTDDDINKTVVDQDTGETSAADTIKISDSEKKKIRAESTADVDDIFDGFRNRK